MEMWLRRQTQKRQLFFLQMALRKHTTSPSMRARFCSYMGRGLTLLMATALTGALAIPFVFLVLFVLWVHFFFIGVASAAYLLGSWLGGVVGATLAIGILLRRGAPNDASLRFVEASDESQKEPQPVASKLAS